jgi:hypothetical protein
MKRAFSTAALAAAIFLLLSSCNNEYGILSEIQTEQENSSTSIFYRSSVQAFTRFNDKYFAVTNAIYSRPVSNATGSGWAQVPVGSLGTSYRCRSVAVLGSTLYAVIRDTSDAVLDIYSSADGSTFTALGSSLAAKNIQAIYAAGGDLFAVVNSSSTETTPTYALYYSAGGASFTATGISGGDWIPGVVYDGTYCWTAQGSSVYYGASIPIKTNNATPTTDTITAIVADTTNHRVFVGSNVGYVYGAMGSDPTSWSTGTKAWTDAAAVTALAYLPLPTGSVRLIAGRGMYNSYTSTFYGYYEMPLASASSVAFSGTYIGSDSTSAVLKTNYSTTTQYLFVNGFYYDSTAGRLFILENSSMKKLAALWSNTWDGTSLWGGWITE